MTKRFENKETTIKGFIINLEDRSTEDFEITTQYTRSNAKATEYAFEALAIDPETHTVVITSIANEKATPVRYNNGKVFELAIDTFEFEENANDFANNLEDDAIVKRIDWFEYEAQFWGVNVNEYITDVIRDDSPLSMTKVDMREFLAYSARDLYGYDIIGIHNATKTATYRWCVITRENLAKCVVEK